MGADLQLPRLPILDSAHSHPYESSIASSAASSCSSVFSADEALSQTSVSSSGSRHTFQDFEGPCIEVKSTSVQVTSRQPFTHAAASLHEELPSPSHQRQQHPRRSSATVCHRPPPLVRQCERKGHFVDNLVDFATQIVEVIWPLSVPSCREGSSSRGVLTLRTFIQETLKRSQSSFSTLQVALYYLVLIKAKVPKHDFTMEQPEDTQSLRALQCGRRMFLAALILASKYLQDRNFSARAWSKISGLQICEINTNEMAFLEAVNWKLHIVDSVYQRWRDLMLHYAPTQHPPRSPPSPGQSLVCDVRILVPLLTPELDRVPLPRKTPSTPLHPDTRSAGSSFVTPIKVPSRDSTPTPYKIPQYLEPKTDVIPPTPSVPRMAPLPTPQMTPQPSMTCTPAASAFSIGTGRSAMCAAMTQAQSMCAARANETWKIAFKPPVAAKSGGSCSAQLAGRRPPLAPSMASLSSSPESLVSDSSSRSSRASSISSISSVWAPQTAILARYATHRNAKLPYITQSGFVKDSGFAESQRQTIAELPSSPELDNLALSDAATERSSVSSSQESTPVGKWQSLSSSRSTCRTRKRGRSSVDLGLQKNVRDLLQASPSLAPLRPVTSCPVGRPSTYYQYMARTPPIFAPLEHTSTNGRMAVHKELGRKRACCAEEAVLGMRKPGPGMWSGIL